MEKDQLRIQGRYVSKMRKILKKKKEEKKGRTKRGEKGRQKEEEKNGFSCTLMVINLATRCGKRPARNPG